MPLSLHLVKGLFPETTQNGAFYSKKLNRMPKSKGAHIFHKLRELPQNTMCHKGDTQ